MNTIYDSRQYRLHCISGLEDQVSNVLQNSSLSSTNGVKKKSVLNELKYCHIINGIPSNIAHDLFESIVCDVLSKVLASFISNGISTCKEMNKKIQGFPYTGSNKTKKADMPYS